MREVDAALWLDGGLVFFVRCFRERRTLDAPGAPAVDAAGKARHRAFRGINRMAAVVGLEIAEAESDQDLVAPIPNAVVGRPSAETPVFFEDDHVFDRSRARRSHRAQSQ